ncbi:MAG: hypothetical protein AUJ49_02205 [Desulfovibrionaceae bacterium CG1_02_65_16]|nr:MAG: hypothetical protein AUJ49_02205 [Desulfovibrionaceae bacterium CG1_02_65_16]
MQEVTSTSATSSLGASFDELRNSALVDASSATRAFSDFMNLVGQTGSGSSSATSTSSESSQASGTVPTVGSGAQNLFTQINAVQNTPPAQPLVQSDTASTLATTSSAASSASAGTTTANVTSASSTNAASSKTASPSSANAASSKTAAATASSLNAGKNTPVSRQAFEEAKPLLLKAGVTEKELTSLSERVQAGTLTWGQLVQTMAGHTAGATKSVKLSDSETANLQSMFQKLGFDSQSSSGMADAMAQGQGLMVLSAIQSKLSTASDDDTMNLTSDELSTFFKALRAPSATAESLTAKLAGDTATVADMKSALTTLGQSLQNQRAQQAADDTATAKSLAKIMQQDIAKNARDTTSETTATGSSGGQVAFDLKTKDKNDTSWFNDHEKNQQKSSDDAWKSFVSKVRQDDSGTQQNAAGSGESSHATATLAAAQAAVKDGVDAAAASRTAQGMATGQQTSATTTTTQAKGFTNVTAPKVLDQVTEAMLKDLGQGRKQLTVELNPDNLGKVQVMLQVKGKEVSAVINAEDSGTAAMLHANMEGLRKSLEEKGLTVQSMEVQTGLASQQDQHAAFNAEQHNQAQEQQQDMSRIFSQLRMMRGDGGDAALDMQNLNMQAILADQGLHLIA